MYAIGIKDGRIRCGNDGVVKLRNLSPRSVAEQTQTLCRISDAVYIVNDFTQRMCEMPHDALVQYVIKNGRRYK